MNMKQCISSCLLSIALIIIPLISFTDCVYVTHHPSWSAWGDTFMNPGEITFSYTNYSPMWVCIFTGIQLILLWVLRKPFACWIGVVLNFLGAIYPGLSMLSRTYASETMNDAIFDYKFAYNGYSFEAPVYWIFTLSVAVIILYIVLFAFRRETDKGLIHVQANPYPVNGMNAYPGSGETEKLINGDNSNQDNGGNIDPISGEEGNEGTLN